MQGMVEELQVAELSGGRESSSQAKQLKHQQASGLHLMRLGPELGS